jgi:hypothetical protein
VSIAITTLSERIADVLQPIAKQQMLCKVVNRKIVHYTQADHQLIHAVLDKHKIDHARTSKAEIAALFNREALKAKTPINWMLRCCDAADKGANEVVYSQHFNKICDLVRERKLNALTSNHLPTHKPDTESLLTQESAESYLNLCGITQKHWILNITSNDVAESIQSSFDAPHTAVQPRVKPLSEHQVQPVQRSTAHQINVLDIVNTLGYNPLALPREKKAGARSEAKKKAKAELPKMSQATFNKAWQALRNDGKLKDAA